MTTKRWKAHAHYHERSTGYFICDDEGPLAEGIIDLDEAQAIADKLNEMEQLLKDSETERSHLEAALKESYDNHVAKREAWNAELLALRAYIQVLEHAADKADEYVCHQGTAKEDAAWTEFNAALAELWKFQKGQV